MGWNTKLPMDFRCLCYIAVTMLCVILHRDFNYDCGFVCQDGSQAHNGCLSGTQREAMAKLCRNCNMQKAK